MGRQRIDDWSFDGIIITGRAKPIPFATSYTKSLTWISLAPNLGLHGKKPAVERLCRL
jgi:hypothetical protein